MPKKWPKRKIKLTKARRLEKGQEKVNAWQKKLSELPKLLEQELKNSNDESSAAKIRKEFKVQSAQIRTKISKIHKECNQFDAELRKRRKRHEKKLEKKLEQAAQQPQVSSIRILSWKTSLEGTALSEKVIQTNADIVLLQWINLASLDACVPDGYKLFQKAGTNGAILMREGIATGELNNPYEEDQEMLSVVVKLPQNEFAITNISPLVASSFNPAMLNVIHERHLIGGDFGALWIEWTGNSVNEERVMVEKFKQEYGYEMVWPLPFLISPHLMPTFKDCNIEQLREIDENVILLSWTMSAAPQLPSSSEVFDPKSAPNYPIRRMLRQRFYYLFNKQWIAKTRGPIPFPEDIAVPGEDRDNWMKLWEKLYIDKERVSEKRLKSTLTGNFANLWKTLPKNTRYLEVPPFPQNTKVPIHQMDYYGKFWEDLWKQKVPQQTFVNLGHEKPTHNTPSQPLQPPGVMSVQMQLESDKSNQEDKSRDKYNPHQLCLKAGELKVLDSGVITRVSETFGYLSAHYYGNVYIPLKAVSQSGSNIVNMRTHLQVGHSVKFVAKPCSPQDDCQWTATYVERQGRTTRQDNKIKPKQNMIAAVTKIAANGKCSFKNSDHHGTVFRPDTDNPPKDGDIVKDKIGTVTKIAENGTYAFIKSQDHGTIFCPGSACKCAKQDTETRLDEVLQVGEEVMFTALKQPKESMGHGGWLAYKVLHKKKMKRKMKKIELKKLANGLVIQVANTFGYLFAKDYGTVYIPLKAVRHSTSNIDDMHMYLSAGDSVKFRAQPQPPMKNCQWAATYVEQQPDVPLTDPDILQNKTAVVTKIATNGKYAFMKSEEHGTVFCPGSACNTQGGTAKRLDEVFEAGDKVQFTAYAQPQEGGGIGWLAVAVTKMAPSEQEQPSASTSNFIPQQGFWHQQASTKTQQQIASRTPNLIGQQGLWQQQGLMKAHQMDNRLTQTPNLNGQESTRQTQQAPVQYTPQAFQPTVINQHGSWQKQPLMKAQQVAFGQKQKRKGKESIWQLQQRAQQYSAQTALEESSYQQSTQAAITHQQGFSHVTHEAAHSSQTVWQPQGFQAPQQMPSQPSQSAQTVDLQGIVLNVSKCSAVVATEQLGDVSCPLSSWMSHNVPHQHTMSLLDVLNVGEFVLLQVARDTPWHAWRPLKLFKPQSQS